MIARTRRSRCKYAQCSLSAHLAPREGCSPDCRGSGRLPQSLLPVLQHFLRAQKSLSQLCDIRILGVGQVFRRKPASSEREVNQPATTERDRDVGGASVLTIRKEREVGRLELEQRR